MSSELNWIKADPVQERWINLDNVQSILIDEENKVITIVSGGTSIIVKPDGDDESWFNSFKGYLQHNYLNKYGWSEGKSTGGLKLA